MEFLTSIIGHRFTIGLRGKIEANFKLSDEINAALSDSSTISEIVFVLRKVDSYDEKGIDAWFSEIKRMSAKGHDLTFIECPKPLLAPLLKNKDSIKAIRSFVVPYYCSECNEEYPQLINTSSMSLSFSAYSKPICPTCNKQLGLDITEDEVERIASLLPIQDTYDDKRKYPRFDVTAYNITAKIKSDNKMLSFDIVNFSEEGMCITGKKLIETGQNIEIDINYKGIEVHSSGTIVWYSTESPSSYLLGISLTTRDIFHLLIKS